MKHDHIEFEKLLRIKGITKKAFAQYAKIPYFTVAGWKKSGSVPAYAMVLLRQIPSIDKVTAAQLIDKGIPKAIFWNNDLSKAVPADILIASTLQRAYNDFIIEKLIEFFGANILLASLMKHRSRLSDRLIDRVLTTIEKRGKAA